MILRSLAASVGLMSAVALIAAVIPPGCGLTPPPQAAKAGFIKFAVNEDFSAFDLRNPSKDPTYWHIYPFRVDVSSSLIFVKDGVLNLMTAPHHGTAAMIKTMAPPDETAA
jgi:hypothetical protein